MRQGGHYSNGGLCAQEPRVSSFTWVSGMIDLSPGLELKKEERGEATTTGSGLTKPLRSQLGIVFSSVFNIRVSMA